MSFQVEAQLEELARPEVFGASTPVEIVQTHISVVCLVGDQAYKFKKAVRLPFVDFSTPELRERACRDELRLNRRLCPDVYLEVVPLRRTAVGLRAGAATPAGGSLVDHGVRMRRLPAERMLDVLLGEGTVTAGEIEDLARRVARFHASAAAEVDAEVRDAGAPDALLAQIRANFRDTAGSPGLDRDLHAALRHRVERALPGLRTAMQGRAAAGRIVEGHGDLHARNICMTSPPSIYDCIEFRRDFRCGDVATEVAFLAMDLRHRGHRALAEAFVEAYVAASGDRGLPLVLPELIRYRAMVRTKVGTLVAADASIPAADRERAAGTARRHLRLAAWTRVEDDGPLALVATGLPASGKSYVLERLAAEAGWPLFATDRIRKELAGVAAAERLPDGCYGQDFSDRTYAELIGRAARTEGAVILDGNFPDLARRAAAVAAVEAAGKRAVLLHFAVEDEVARARLGQRSRDPVAVSDADEAVYERLRARYEPPTGADRARIVAVDGGLERERALDLLATALL
jgi:aminoglycoside phosphotransferase family enzyme/predicted kinase